MNESELQGGSPPGPPSSLRVRLNKLLDPSAWGRKGLSPLNWTVCALIVIAGTLAVLETEPTLTSGNEHLFIVAEIVFAAVFLVEYVARVWSSAENPSYGPGFVGRIRYMASWPALIDIVALAPVLLTPFGSETFLLRLLRLARILSVARLGRFTGAMTLLAEAARSRMFELLLSLCVGLVLLVISSTMIYLAEAQVQPAAFGSIPRAMWWAIVTLTTVGYGDVYPITVVGKMFAGLTAVMGIGLIAMPTGILAAAVSDAIRRHRVKSKSEGEGV